MSTVAKSKAVRGKYWIVLPGEGTFERRQRTYSQMRREMSFAEKTPAKQSHYSGWTRVIRKISALNRRRFDIEKSYVPSGIIHS